MSLEGGSPHHPSENDARHSRLVSLWPWLIFSPPELSLQQGQQKGWSSLPFTCLGKASKDFSFTRQRLYSFLIKKSCYEYKIVMTQKTLKIENKNMETLSNAQYIVTMSPCIFIKTLPILQVQNISISKQAFL